MKKKFRIKKIFFYLFLLLAVFGIFFFYLYWTYHRNPPVINPAGEIYRINPSARFEKPGVISFDFEQPQPAGIEFSGIARSGRQSLRVSGSRSFSPVINIPLNEIDSSDFGHIAFSAWINFEKFNGPADASLVFLISNTAQDVLLGKTIRIKGIDFTQGKWFKVSSAFKTDNYMYNPNDRIRIYLRNQSDNEILMDDLEIIFGEQHLRSDSSSSGNSDTLSRQESAQIHEPPFYFYKEQIGNADAEFLINNAKEKKGNFIGNEFLIAGNFIHAHGNPQEILSVTSGRFDLYFFLQAEKLFTVASAINHVIPQMLTDPNDIICGDFDNDTFDEILFIYTADDNYLLLDPRMFGNGSVSANEMLFSIQGLKKFSAFYSYDANGNGKDDLLAINASGDWKILELKDREWIVCYAGNTAVPEWSEKNYNVKIIPGKFTGATKNEQLLTVSENKSTHQTGVSVFEFDAAKDQFMKTIEIPSGMNDKNFTGRLRPEDEFFPAKVHAGKTDEIIMRRNDWRFDMKIFTVNDTSFTTTGNFDFAGYSEDFNPKYQETLKIIPGKFINADITSLLVIARQRSDEKKYFPNTVQLYSPERK